MYLGVALNVASEAVDYVALLSDKVDPRFRWERNRRGRLKLPKSVFGAGQSAGEESNAWTKKSPERTPGWVRLRWLANRDVRSALQDRRRIIPAVRT